MVRKISGKSHKKRTHKAPAKRRTVRRRISGAGDIGGMALTVAGLGAGSIAARELNTLLVKFMPSLGTSPMLSGGIQVGVGLFLPKFVKGPFMANVGMGMIANGVMVMAVSTGIINGAPDRVAYRLNGSAVQQRRMNGTANLPVVSGTGNLPIVAGRAAKIKSHRTFRSVVR